MTAHTIHPTCAHLRTPFALERRRLYGLCGIVSLAFLIVARQLGENSNLGHVYMPLFGLSLLVISLAGVEYHLYLQRVLAERAALQAKREEAEHQAIERQRAFNRLWQCLADGRGQPQVSPEILTELAGLFSADMVAIWSRDPNGQGFNLRGAHPLANDGVVRLEKVAHMSPCFDRLQDSQTMMLVTNHEEQTSKGFAWFCEENQFQETILCPVLVRRDLIGVFALFFREKQTPSTKLQEEMQAAANLFLCAL